MSAAPPNLLQPEERVLSTLEADGRRRWIHPRLAKGKLWRRRLIVAWGLIAFFTILPWTTVGGEPTVLLDIVRRRFTIFGFTFLPTDTVLLAIAVLTAFLSIFFATAVLGRVWCGWGCPQTVYLEFVFRPIERFFMGRTGVGGKPTKAVPTWRYVAMYAMFLAICLHLANTFLAYFVGVENLNRWIWTSTPVQHPGPFALVVFVAGLMMFDFAYWREQMCIIGCPYGRFQSVLLDRQSLVVSYDKRRGEPRGRGRKADALSLPVLTAAVPAAGDCVDCTMCVQVCPTGIDIRQGLQLECINCAQCIDACDAVMAKLHRPLGLIGYSSQAAIEGEQPRRLRPRVVLYPTLIALLATLFVVLLSTKPTADVTVLRSLGRPFVVTDAGEVENTLRVKITNRTDEPQRYRVTVKDRPELRVVSSLAEIEVAAGESRTEALHIVGPDSAFRGGKLDATLRVTDTRGLDVEHDCRLLGPAHAGDSR